MVDIAVLRKNMVESQVMTCDVTDRRILRAMLELPRERFVPKPLRSLAYMDEAIRLSAPGAAIARFLPAPMTTAKLIALADVTEGEVVLEIGAANGYATAILARLARTVVGLEGDAELAAAATANLLALGVANARVVAGPPAAGRADLGPYDVILISGSIPELPDALGSQLNAGGRIIAVTGTGSLGQAMVFVRRDGGLAGIRAFNATAPLLPGFEKAPVFAL